LSGVLLAGGGLVLVGGRGVLVAGGGAGVLVAAGGGVAVDCGGLVELGGAAVGVLAPVVAVGGDVVAVASTEEVGAPPTSVRRIGDGPLSVDVAGAVGVGPHVFERLGVGVRVAVGGNGLSPGAEVRAAVGSEVGNRRLTPSGVGAPVPSPWASASNPGASTGVPLAESVWSTAT
jgi:hypothetical protein